MILSKQAHFIYIIVLSRIGIFSGSSATIIPILGALTLIPLKLETIRLIVFAVTRVTIVLK